MKHDHEPWDVAVPHCLRHSNFWWSYCKNLSLRLWYQLRVPTLVFAKVACCLASCGHWGYSKLWSFFWYRGFDFRHLDRCGAGLGCSRSPVMETTPCGPELKMWSWCPKFLLSNGSFAETGSIERNNIKVIVMNWDELGFHDWSSHGPVVFTCDH